MHKDSFYREIKLANSFSWETSKPPTWVQSYHFVLVLQYLECNHFVLVLQYLKCNHFLLVHHNISYASFMWPNTSHTKKKTQHYEHWLLVPWYYAIHKCEAFQKTQITALKLIAKLQTSIISAFNFEQSTNIFLHVFFWKNLLTKQTINFYKLDLHLNQQWNSETMNKESTDNSKEPQII